MKANASTPTRPSAKNSCCCANQAAAIAFGQEVTTIVQHGNSEANRPVALHEAALGNVDRHNPLLTERKVKLKGIAALWQSQGRITLQQLQDIYYEIDHSERSDWRPLIYIVPSACVLNRCKSVPAAQRAGLGAEWIIADLRAAEFDFIETTNA